METIKAYQLQNGTKLITDQPNVEPSDDNVTFEQDFYQESSQTISQAYNDIVVNNFEQIEVDDISEFGREDEKQWITDNYYKNK